MRHHGDTVATEYVKMFKRRPTQRCAIPDTSQLRPKREVVALFHERKAESIENGERGETSPPASQMKLPFSRALFSSGPVNASRSVSVPPSPRFTRAPQVCRAHFAIIILTNSS